MSSDTEDEMGLTPSTLSDASNMQDGESGADVLKFHETLCSEDTHEDVVLMPLSTPPSIPKRICGRELSIAELKTALGTACGRNWRSQEYCHSKPTASKPPVSPHCLSSLETQELLEIGICCGKFR